MAIVVADITTSFPELAPAGAPLIGAKLAEATSQVNYAIYEQASGDMAVKYLTAHLIAISPFGQSARLAAKDGSSVYQGIFRDLQTAAAGGYRNT